MNPKYIKLYDNLSKSDCTFLLNQGRVIFYASEMDKYTIKGKNLIIGATEIIMTYLLNNKTHRIETAVADSSSKIKRISVDKFLSAMDVFSFALNVSMVIAKQVLLTNNIVHKNIDELTGETNKHRVMSIEFYRIVETLIEEYRKRKLPWLNEFIKKHVTTLTYKRGEAFSKSSDPTLIETSVNLSDNLDEYPRGAVICEENTQGEEMYILKSGVIDVIIDNNKVAAIKEPGTVFGEMALLLNEKRTATLKAKNNVVLTKITKKNLKAIVEKQKDLLKNIAISLAKKHYYNILRIETTNQSIIEKKISKELGDFQKGPDLHKTMMELSRLKNDIEEAYRQKKADFLDELIKTF